MAAMRYIGFYRQPVLLGMVVALLSALGVTTSALAIVRPRPVSVPTKSPSMPVQACESALSQEANPYLLQKWRPATTNPIKVTQQLAARSQADKNGWLPLVSNHPMHFSPSALQFLGRFVAMTRMVTRILPAANPWEAHVLPPLIEASGMSSHPLFLDPVKRLAMIEGRLSIDADSAERLAKLTDVLGEQDEPAPGISGEQAYAIFNKALAIAAQSFDYSQMEKRDYACVTLQSVQSAAYGFIEKELKLTPEERLRVPSSGDSMLSQPSFAQSHQALEEKKQRYHTLLESALAVTVEEFQKSTLVARSQAQALANGDVDLPGVAAENLRAPRTLKDLSALERVLYLGVMAQLVERNKHLAATHFMNPVSGKREVIQIEALREIGQIWNQLTGRSETFQVVAMYFELVSHHRVQEPVLRAIEIWVKRQKEKNNQIPVEPLASSERKQVKSNVAWPTRGKCVHCVKEIPSN